MQKLNHTKNCRKKATNQCYGCNLLCCSCYHRHSQWDANTGMWVEASYLQRHTALLGNTGQRNGHSATVCFFCLFIFNLGSGFQKCWVSQKSATQYSAVQVVSCQLHLCDATWFHRGKWEVTKYFSLSPFHSRFQRGGCCQSHSQRSLYTQIPQSRAFLFENK